MLNKITSMSEITRVYVLDSAWIVWVALVLTLVTLIRKRKAEGSLKKDFKIILNEEQLLFGAVVLTILVGTSNILSAFFVTGDLVEKIIIAITGVVILVSSWFIAKSIFLGKK